MTVRPQQKWLPVHFLPRFSSVNGVARQLHSLTILYLRWVENNILKSLFPSCFNPVCVLGSAPQHLRKTFALEGRVQTSILNLLFSIFQPLFLFVCFLCGLIKDFFSGAETAFKIQYFHRLCSHFSSSLMCVQVLDSNVGFTSVEVYLLKQTEDIWGFKIK